MLDTDQLGIVAGTRNLKTALEFVRFATTAESMAAVSGHIAYSLCLLFIHPRAPNLIDLWSAGCTPQKVDPVDLRTVLRKKSIRR